MATVTHALVLEQPDVEGMDDRIRPSSWNAAHTVSLVDADVPASVARAADVAAAILAAKPWVDVRDHGAVGDGEHVPGSLSPW